MPHELGKVKDEPTGVAFGSLKTSVIPAKAGIQKFSGGSGHWIPAFAGMTGVAV
jgi:hypothetical protein